MPLINLTPYKQVALPNTNVSLLMHMEGAGILDSSGNNTFTNNGGAQLSTAQKLFGSQSLQILGNNVRPLVANNNGAFTLGSGDWTIELSINPTSLSSTAMILGTWRSGAQTGATFSWGVFAGINRSIGFSFSTTGSYEGANDRGAANLLTLNTWNRLAFVRNDTSLRMYVNGVYAPFTTGGNSIASGQIIAAGAVFVIGGNVDSQFYNGFIDEVRITKGVALYTGPSYTLATEAFPD